MSTLNYSQLLKAAAFAAGKHRDQRRKNEGASPYINHPAAVARILAEVGGVEDAAILAAALLHDTLEDTDTTAEELEQEFGPDVRRYVEEVTDDMSLSRIERQERQIAHAEVLSPGAAMIKIADKISNVTDVIHDPPPMWGLERREQYLDVAEKVVNNCPSVSDALERRFADVLKSGREHLSQL